MSSIASTPSANQRSRGRSYFWAGIVVCVLGAGAAVAQFALKYLGMPWYSPVLATLGAILLVVAVARRRTVPRLIALVLVTAFAGLQWYFVVSFLKPPVYEGPVQVGKQMPPFRVAIADGSPFTEANLRDGSRHVLAFFRGRW